MAGPAEMPQEGQPARPVRAARDLRLDLARGLTMLIILVAHMPTNPLADWIPAKMGFSSGAEAFVLCSGLACGLAFGRSYQRAGWREGTRRIVRRIGQLWAIQLMAFALFVVMLLGIDTWLGGQAYAARYALDLVTAAPLSAFAALASLRYVPIYFDILPLYIVLLALVPVAMLLARLSPRLVLGVSGLLWLSQQIVPLALPAHPDGGGTWYFNPLAWQFLFLLGYGVTAGWLTAPAPTRWRIRLVLGFVLLCVPVTFWWLHPFLPLFRDLFVAIYPADAITTLHPLRLVHALALGWLFAVLLKDKGEALSRPWLRPVIAVGQQSLPTFIGGVFLSALGGVALDQWGHDPGVVAAVNGAGLIALVAIALAARSAKGWLSQTSRTREMQPCPPPSA